MKKINFLFILLGLFTLTFLASCGTEDEVNLPILTISPSSAQELVEGDTLTVSLTAGENPTSKKALKTLVIKLDGATLETVNLSGSTYANDFEFVVPAARTSAYVYTFELTDRDEVSTTRTLNVTSVVEAQPAGPISTYTATLLGAQANASTGSAFASSNGQVYTKAAATTNSTLIDFVYFFGATNQATIAAPDDATVDGSTANSVDLTENYATKNPTRFQTTSITPAQFTAMTDDADFPAFTGTAKLVNQLSVDNVFAFETAAGKVGLVHVSNIVTANTGSITINVKVQD